MRGFVIIKTKLTIQLKLILKFISLFIRGFKKILTIFLQEHLFIYIIPIGLKDKIKEVFFDS